MNPSDREPDAHDDETGGSRAFARDLAPGTRLRHTPSGDVVVLDRRKKPGEFGFDGWWLVNHGGLADRVIDDPDGRWEVLDG